MMNEVTDDEIRQAAEEIARGRQRAKTAYDRDMVSELAANLVRVRLQRSRQLVARLGQGWRP